MRVFFKPHPRSIRLNSTSFFQICWQLFETGSCRMFPSFFAGFIDWLTFLQSLEKPPQRFLRRPPPPSRRNLDLVRMGILFFPPLLSLRFHQKTESKFSSPPARVATIFQKNPNRRGEFVFPFHCRSFLMRFGIIFIGHPSLTLPLRTEALGRPHSVNNCAELAFRSHHPGFLPQVGHRLCWTLIDTPVSRLSPFFFFVFPEKFALFRRQKRPFLANSPTRADSSYRESPPPPKGLLAVRDTRNSGCLVELFFLSRSFFQFGGIVRNCARAATPFKGDRLPVFPEFPFVAEPLFFSRGLFSLHSDVRRETTPCGRLWRFSRDLIPPPEETFGGSLRSTLVLVK